MFDPKAMASVLESADKRIAVVRADEAKLARETACYFQPFSYMRDDELGVCRMFADLLRPDGEHGQGSFFLREFLTTIGLSPEGADAARISREEVTKETDESSRRVDVYVELGDGRVIGIEAKPFAGESKGQVENEMNFIEARAQSLSGDAARAWLVFLTSDGREPETIGRERLLTLRAEKRVIPFRFNAENRKEGEKPGSLREWLDRIALMISASRLNWFLSELARYLDDVFPVPGRGGSNMDMSLEVVKHVVAQPSSNRLAAFFVACARDVLYAEVVRSFVASIKTRLSSLDPTYAFEDDLSGDPLERFASLTWRNSSWPAHAGIVLQIDNVRKNPARSVLGFGFVAPSTAVSKKDLNAYVPVADASREAIRRAVGPLFRSVGTIEYDYWNWWPVYVLPSKPLDHPFTPEGLAVISASREYLEGRWASDVIVECFRAIYMATKDISIKSA